MRVFWRFRTQRDSVRQNVRVTDVKISIDVTDADHDRLKPFLGDSSRSKDLLDALLKAGAREALAYATGVAVFSTMAELRMFRVRQLLECGVTADECERLVAGLFKMTPAGARRVVTATFARYPFELEQHIHASVTQALGTATETEGRRWLMTLIPGMVKDRILAECAASKQPNPVNTQGAVWRFSDETYAHLRAKWEIGTRTWIDPAP